MIPEADAIRNAPNMRAAQAICNDVAMAAMKRLRPESEADACREAFFDRWRDDLLAVQRTQHVPAPRYGYHGD